MSERIVDPELQEEDQQIDYTLRPQYLREFIGQERVKERLEISLYAAKRRGQALEHVLLVGPPGLGKTTLASIIANEMGSGFKPTIGTTLEKQLQLSSILTELQDEDVLFIDEIHRMRKDVQEMLYPAMEDFRFDVPLGVGVGADVIQIPLNRFTLVGATTREGLLSNPFLERFGIRLHLNYYPAEDLYTIVDRNAKTLNIKISEEGALEIARRGRGTPRIANRLLRRVWDYAIYKNENLIIKEIASEALKLNGIDERGLTDQDRLLLRTMIEKFGGRPIGLKVIARAMSEDERTIEEVYEPYLIKLGFLSLTPKGRVATEFAYKHLGLIPSSTNSPSRNQGKLF